jgi:polysaccharide pyruvyl transferase WcaK-like protein
MILIDEDFSPEVIKSIISTMDIFISTRLHPTIFSVSQAVPTMALHSQNKVRDFMVRCNLSEYFFSIENTNVKTWVNTAIYLLEKRHEVSNRIRAILPALSKAAGENMAIIETCINDTAGSNK